MKTFLSRVLASLMFEEPGAPGGGGGAPAGGGQPGGGAPAPQAVKIDPNGMYDFGDGKPTRFSDFQSRHMPKDQYDRGVEFLQNIAKTLDTQRAGQRPPAQQQQQQQQRPPADPFADVWDAPLVDGPMLRKLYENGLGPLAKAIQAQQQKIAALEQQQKGVVGQVGSLAERTASGDYNTMIDSTISGLQMPGLDPKHPEIAPLMPLLREFVQDVFESHDQNDPKYAKEMPGIFKSRFEGVVKLVRAMDKVRVEAGRQQRRTFTRPGGTAQPNGKVGYKHEDGTALAARLFASTAPQT